LYGTIWTTVGQHLRDFVSQVVRTSTRNRSRVTNGSELLRGVDGRSAEGRRYRDLTEAFRVEFGLGASEREMAAIRLAAALTARIDEAAYAKALAETLFRLVCSDKPHSIEILRGILANRRIQDTKEAAPTLIELIMSGSCPLATKLTSDDVAMLKGQRCPPPLKSC
jgi:hypothetical protein